MILHCDAAEVRRGKYILGYISTDMLIKESKVVSCKDNNEAEMLAVKFALEEYPDAEVFTDSENAVRTIGADNVKHVRRDANLCNPYLRAKKSVMK